MDTMRTSRTAPRIGEVYNMYFEGTGSEQSGWRPGVVFQNNAGNNHSPNVIALPLTSSLKRLDMPTHVLIPAEGTGLRRDSVVICENPVCLSKEKVGRYITTLDDSHMKQIAIGHLTATSALSYMDLQAVIAAWKNSVRLNNVN